MMYLPLDKIFTTQLRSQLEPEAIDFNTECVVIDRADHPGSFGFKRKHHRHEGVDLYANHGDGVFAISAGTVVAVIDHFTGPQADSPWWNNTAAVMVQDDTGVWLYGEIEIDPSIRDGMAIVAGQKIGTVSTVLTKDKGRPMSMLHIERYVSGTTTPIDEWSLDTNQPPQLLDPTPLLTEAVRLNFLLNPVTVDDFLFLDYNMKEMVLSKCFVSTNMRVGDPLDRWRVVFELVSRSQNYARMQVAIRQIQWSTAQAHRRA